MKNKRFIIVLLVMVVVAAIVSTIIVIARNNSDDAAQQSASKPVAKEKSHTIDKNHPPKEVSFGNPMLIMGAGEAFTPNVLYDGELEAQDASFSCDRPAILTVDEQTGAITAQQDGFATVTVKSFNGLTADCYVTVKKAPSKVAFPVDTLQLQKGEETSLTLMAPVYGEGFAVAEYSSENSDVLSVSENGTVNAKSEGTVTVTGTTYNGSSAQVTVTVVDGGFTSKTTAADAPLQKEAGWSFQTLDTVPGGSEVQQYGESSDGRWLHVKYKDTCGWIYNKAFGGEANYSDFTLETLPVMADDLLFDTGTDKRAIFDFVYQINYGTNGDDTDENLCVDYFRTGKGSCFHHGAMLCYLYNRCGYDTVRVVGLSAYDGVSEHSWCLSKTDKGWKHVDAQYFTIREADEQFFVDDYSQFFKWDTEKYPDTVKR